MPQKGQRQSILNTLGFALAQRDLRAAGALLDRLAAPEREAVADHVFGGATDGRAATELAFAQPPSSSKARLLGRALRLWAETEPTEALDWAARLPMSESRTEALRGAALEWARRDAGAALDEWMKRDVGNASGNDMTFAHLVREWARQEPAKAVSWAKEIPPGNARSVVLNHLTAELAETDPQQAITLATSLNGAERTQAMKSAALGWSESSPADAAKWVSGWTDPQLQSDAMRDIVRRWVRSDFRGVSDFQQTLPPGVARDHVTSLLAEQLASYDPSAAAVQAANVGNLDYRRHTIETVARNWLRVDTDAAQVWLDTRPEVTPEMRALLLAK